MNSQGYCSLPLLPMLVLWDYGFHLCFKCLVVYREGLCGTRGAMIQYSIHRQKVMNVIAFCFSEYLSWPTWVLIPLLRCFYTREVIWTILSAKRNICFKIERHTHCRSVQTVPLEWHGGGLWPTGYHLPWWQTTRQTPVLMVSGPEPLQIEESPAWKGAGPEGVSPDWVVWACTRPFAWPARITHGALRGMRVPGNEHTQSHRKSRSTPSSPRLIVLCMSSNNNLK